MDFPVWTLIPFVLMLAGIAVFPLVPQLAHLWERPRNQLIYALVLFLSSYLLYRYERGEE